MFEKRRKAFLSFPPNVHKRQRRCNQTGSDHQQNPGVENRDGQGRQDARHHREHHQTRRRDMQVRLVQHPLQLRGGLHANQPAIHPWYLAHQLVAREHHLYIFSVSRMKEGFRQTLLQASALCVRPLRRQQIRAEHEKEREQKYQEGDQHIAWLFSRVKSWLERL